MLKNGITVALAVLLLGLQWRIWVSDDGIHSRDRIAKQVQAAHDENRQLAIRNAELAAEVQDLKSGLAAIESRARTTLGMVKPEEAFFLVVQ